MSDEFITSEDFFDQTYRSPPLQAAQPNYLSSETPPPLDLIDDCNDSDTTGTTGEGENAVRSKSSKGRPQPSVCDSMLMKLLGPNYPEVASAAGREFITLSPEVACEDRRPVVCTGQGRMLSDTFSRGIPGSTDHNKVLAHAAFEASQKLNAAIRKDGGDGLYTSVLQSKQLKTNHMVQIQEIGQATAESLSRIYEQQTHHRNSMTLPRSPRLSPSRALNVKPPPKVSLPPIRTRSPGSASDWMADQSDSIATSPALAKFTITPAEPNAQQQLPRLHHAPAQHYTGQSPQHRQTLPPLKTALREVSDVEPSTYPNHSVAASRPSPSHFTQFGMSPSNYSNHSPAAAISPPRISSNPSFWQTARSENTSNSTPSDHTSGAPSAGISTPATSYFGHSPSNSVNTPSTIVPDNDAMSTASASSSQLTDGHNQFNANYGPGSFKCVHPDCTAPPFQTQYLLNSHANVHSNTRPHFCPVHGCPRGPGGQGFKRKNEMIRHGLVHQSPGYVCPFCPDQLHRYPRPDNLQRHVRVHHDDKDRDDPLLRDVLAQRPEGGNRGRRRRLGS